MPPKMEAPIGLKEWLAMPENEKKRLEAIAKNKAVREARAMAKKEMEVKPEALTVAKPKEGFTFTNDNSALKENDKQVNTILKALVKPYGIAKIRKSGVEFRDKKKIVIQDYDITEKEYFDTFRAEMIKQHPDVDKKIRSYLWRWDLAKPIPAVGIINRKTNQVYLQLSFPDDKYNPSQIFNDEGWPQEILVLSNVEKYPPGSRRGIPLIMFLESKLRFKNRDEILRFIFQ